MIELPDIIQGTDKWFEAKIGLPSASNFYKIITSKGAPSQQAADYAYTLAGEQIVMQKTETFQTKAMTRGLLLEAEARQLFEFLYGINIRQTGLIYNDQQQYLCSPDGIIDEWEAGIEIKCPLMHTHVKYLLAGELPTEYVQQVQGSMLVTGFIRWHFFSYYPGLPPLHLEIERNEVLIGEMEQELKKFSQLIDNTVEQLKGIST